MLFFTRKNLLFSLFLLLSFLFFLPVQASEDFSEKDYQRALQGEKNLNRALLEGANFQGMSFTDVNFSRADLENANFSDTTLIRVNFKKADLEGASFKNAVLTDVSFYGAELEYAVWVNGRVCSDDSVSVCR